MLTENLSVCLTDSRFESWLTWMSLCLLFIHLWDHETFDRSSYHRAPPSASLSDCSRPQKAADCFAGWLHSVRHTHNETENITLNVRTQHSHLFVFVLPCSLPALERTAPPRPPFVVVSCHPSPLRLLLSPPARGDLHLLESHHPPQEIWEETPVFLNHFNRSLSNSSIGSDVSPAARCVYIQVSHSGQQGQVVIVRVENPYSDTAHCQLLGKLEA